MPITNVSGPLAFSPRGDVLAVGQGATIGLYSLPDLTLLRTLDHGTTVRAIIFSPDGDLLAAGGEFSRALLWRVHDGSVLHTLPRPSGVDSFGVAIWRVADGQACFWAGKADWGKIPSVAFAAEDSRLIALDLNTSRGDWIGPTSLRFLEVATQRELSAIATVAILDGTLSTDGTILGFVTRGVPQVWQVEATGVVRPLRALPTLPSASGPFGLRLSGDKRRLAAVSRDHGTYLWRIEDGTLLHLFDRGGALAEYLAISFDGTQVATLCQDGFLRLWHAD